MKKTNKFYSFFYTHIRNLFLISFLLVMFSGLGLSGQQRMVFEELDHALIGFYVGAENDKVEYDRLLKVIDSEWNRAKEIIESSDFQYFDNAQFIEDQNRRMQIITRLVTQDRITHVKPAIFDFLKEFSDSRKCIATDDYDLDIIIESYDSYLSVHDIIHDEMMGLYEWREFIGFVDNLKCNVEEMGYILENKMVSNSSREMKSAYIRLEQCLNTLYKSMENAYTPDFVLPCDDLQVAFMDFFRAYIRRVDI